MTWLLAIMDNSTGGVQKSTDLLAHYSSYAGLKINEKKTKFMAISKCASQRPYIEDDYIEIEVDGEPVEQVSIFIYLGVTISGDGKINKDLDVRIQRANGAFHQLWKIWNSRTDQDPYIQGGCHINPVIWIRSLEYHKKADEEI